MVVEDEERARRTLRSLIRTDPELELLAETAGADAPRVIEQRRPELLLLDVEMPSMNGFEVLARLAPDRMPVVIFVTAYDRYAIAAFEASAVDYLLKPFSDDRLFAALARGKHQVRQRGRNAEGGVDLAARLKRLLDALGPAQRLLLRDGARTLLLEPGEIDWVEADGVYVRVHSGKENLLVRERLSVIEARLSDRGFFRIHRSALVNLDRVVELKHRSHGDYSVRLRDGTSLTLARARKDALEQQLRRLEI